jgi:Protein of unknown function (DUF3097)
VWNRQYGSDVLADGQSGRSGRRRVQRGVPTVEAERGLVVEYLGGIDDLPAIVTRFSPAPGRRLGVLVDHLVAGRVEELIDFVTAPGND